ncbi:hypothetical protein [Butyrivibrio sp. AC2005]|uniref:hypothetical protein n=1 Tax=Butyrivibrio sp. AC2005 TaxID=1280672 RepID=UPI00040EEB0D|nr:hypothetical protein [Butyrivibrio sp. AC2005]
MKRSKVAGGLAAAGTACMAVGSLVGQSKRILRLRLRDTEFDKTTSKKVKRIQSGEKGRLL